MNGSISHPPFVLIDQNERVLRRDHSRHFLHRPLKPMTPRFLLPSLEIDVQTPLIATFAHHAYKAVVHLNFQSNHSIEANKRGIVLAVHTIKPLRIQDPFYLSEERSQLNQ